MWSDLLIYETGNGGDLLLRGNDLVKINGMENSLYLAMFGGRSWWGNYLTKNKFQSQTEEALRTNALTSVGRLAIENAVKADLTFLEKIPNTKYSVVATITNSNRLDIEINVNGKTFNYEWNPDTMFLKYKV